MSIIRRIYYIVKNLKIKDLTYRAITSADKIFYGLADDSNMHYASVDDITGASSSWEADDASTIKPKDSKLVKATKIEEDTAHSFITDAERIDWDSKAVGVHYHRQYWSNDFLYYQYGYPWIGVAIAAGTCSTYTTGITGDRPGVIYFRSITTNANSGYSQSTQAIGTLLGGEKTTGIFYIGALFAISTSKIYFGFMNYATASAITQGAYIEITGTTGSPVVATANSINGAGNITTHGTTATLSVTTWYKYEVTVNADKTSINYKITTSPNISTLLDVDIATNLPTTALYCTAKAYTSEAATASTYLMLMDFIDLEINRVLNR